MDATLRHMAGIIFGFINLALAAFLLVASLGLDGWAAFFTVSLAALVAAGGVLLIRYGAERNRDGTQTLIELLHNIQNDLTDAQIETELLQEADLNLETAIAKRIQQHLDDAQAKFQKAETYAKTLHLKQSR